MMAMGHTILRIYPNIIVNSCSAWYLLINSLAQKLGTSLVHFYNPANFVFLIWIPLFVSLFMIVPRFSCSLWSPLDLAITAVVQFGDHQLLSYLYANPQNSVTLTHHSPRTLTKSTRWTAWYHTPCRGSGMDKPGVAFSQKVRFVFQISQSPKKIFQKTTLNLEF